MNKLQMIQKKTAGRGLRRVLTMIAVASALLMFAGSAQAQSADRSFSIQIDSDQISLSSLRNAITAGRGVAENANSIFNRRDWRPGNNGRIRPNPWIRPRPIIVRPPVRPDPVTAVPEPGAALLFGAGIVMAASIRRR